MIWCFVWILAALASDRPPCPPLTIPATTDPVRAQQVPLETMILIIAYQEHRGVFFFGDEPRFRSLNQTYGVLTSKSVQWSEAFASTAPTPLSRERYAALLDQNAEVSAWIRRKLVFIVNLSLRPSMRATIRDVTEQARRDGLPPVLPVTPLPADPP